MLHHADFYVHQCVSIHAPARGATAQPTRFLADTRSFNPRPRAGGDLLVALTATITKGFNPRPRAGGDVEWGKC